MKQSGDLQSDKSKNARKSTYTLVCILAFMETSSFALTRDQVRRAQKTAGIKSWTTAAETREKIHFGGVIEEAGSERFAPDEENEVDGPSIGQQLPSSFDWRDIHGVDYASPLVSQGGCGSCVSFAAASTLEMQLDIACNTPNLPFVLSKQYLHSCGGASCAKGWLLSKAVEFLVDTGVPDEACLPYAGIDVQCSKACSDAPRRSVKIVNYDQPTNGFINLSAIKQALLKGPLLTSMILYEDFEHYQNGIYRHVAGLQQGSHAITLIGWNDADRAWIARNSAGPGWGENGYFRVAWDDPKVLVGRYTWHFDVSQAVREGVCSRKR